MAFMMEPGRTEPLTEEEEADVAAIQAIRESSVVELKDQGNEFLKKGKKHYNDAIDCYTRAINTRLDDSGLNSVLYGNRAQVNLLLGNYRRVVEDAEEAIRLNPSNVKAYYRGSKAALALSLWKRVEEFCAEGSKVEPGNKEFQSMRKQAADKQAALDEAKQRALLIKSKAEALVSALEKRKLSIGPSRYRDRTGHRRPSLDRSGIMHWPVLLLYGEFMTSDLIEDFAETDMFRSHLDDMFGVDAPRLTWDEANAYQRDKIELYYQANGGTALPKKQLLKSLMEGEVGLEGLDLDPQSDSPVKDEPCWVKVEERRTLHEILSRPDHVLPGVPVFLLLRKAQASGRRFCRSGRHHNTWV